MQLNKFQIFSKNLIIIFILFSIFFLLMDVCTESWYYSLKNITPEQSFKNCLNNSQNTNLFFSHPVEILLILTSTYTEYLYQLFLLKSIFPFEINNIQKIQPFFDQNQLETFFNFLFQNYSQENFDETFLKKFQEFFQKYTSKGLNNFELNLLSQCINQIRLDSDYIFYFDIDFCSNYTFLVSKLNSTSSKQEIILSLLELCNILRDIYLEESSENYQILLKDFNKILFLNYSIKDFLLNDELNEINLKFFHYLREYKYNFLKTIEIKDLLKTLNQGSTFTETKNFFYSWITINDFIYELEKDKILNSKIICFDSNLQFKNSFIYNLKKNILTNKEFNISKEQFLEWQTTFNHLKPIILNDLLNNNN